VDWQGIGVFAFTRRDRNHALGFHARTPEPSAWQPRAPLDLADGWSTASPKDVGLDEGRLGALVARLQQTGAAGASQVQGLLIARHGKLAVEEYFHGFDAARPHDTRSAGKTFAPLLVGLAMAHGRAFSPGTPVLTLLPGLAVPAGQDPRKARITVADLMSMTSGLACDDNDGQSPGNEDTMQGQHRQDDWYRYAIELPMAREPGGPQAVYCSAGINLLGAVVAKATGRWLPAFFDEYVARPLQMRGYHINLMPDGDAYLAGGIYLRPRDMLKLGQLYLSGGTWHGRRVVDASWVRASTTEHSRFAPDHRYGYGWHLHTFRAGGRDYREYAAEGNGGQFVIVLPELDLTVAITAGNYGDFRTWYALQELVSRYVIPAVRDARESGVPAARHRSPAPADKECEGSGSPPGRCESQCATGRILAVRADRRAQAAGSTGSTEHGLAVPGISARQEGARGACGSAATRAHGPESAPPSRRRSRLAWYIAWSARARSVSGWLPSSGKQAMPMLASRWNVPSGRLKGSLRQARRPSATVPAACASQQPGSRATNSSPPMRAIRSSWRRPLCRRRPTSRSRRSPTLCPYWSLMRLKPSRSR
jgi:CubicO group peptidase (beta-lactamase class C family)